ncbi:midasin-like [Centruroides sculpturatus]|uniref:midasin-like n=1 Tax=Centruroides sculpturatus TaxID=218467 RepID=UPI000C6D63DD|nr:midasin-like [Centruroides sculpturatus]
MENFNVTTAFTSLCKHIDVNKLSVEIRRDIQRLLSKQIKSSLDYQQMLDIVSSLLLEESYTLLVADYFSPLLLELLTHCKISENLHYRTCFSKYEIIGIILAKLVGKYSVVSEFCLHYFDGQPSLLERYEQNEEFACKKKKMDGEIYDDILQKLLEATFCLLIHNFNFFRKIWNLSILVDMIKDKNLDIKWFSFPFCHEIFIIFNQVLTIKLQLLLGSHCCTDIPGEFIWKPGPLTQAMISGSWLLLEDIDYAPMDIMSLIIPVLQSKSLMLPGHADLHNSTNLVLVPSVKLTLRNLSLGIVAGECMLLQGAVGCGKTALIEYMAQITGRQLIKVQLGDQIDSKIVINNI